VDKLKMHTPDFIQENIARLAELFPNCVTETKAEDGSVKRAIDFDQLRQELSDHVVDGPRERYQLNWPGKREALLAANAPIAKTFRPCRNDSLKFDSTRNLFIEGDNLDALKLLQETYLNKVKMIYIDPPYNTGNDFLYNDDFSEDSLDYLLRSSQIDEDGLRLFANTESNGRFHSDWISMIYPRLRLARQLLREDGAIFISIDDNEVAVLRSICDEVFGAGNFIATVIWQKVFSPKNTASYLSVDHDYIVIYARNKTLWRPQLLPRSKETESRYSNPDNDPRGPWLSGAFQARNYYSKGEYEVVSPSGRKFTNPKGTYWRVSSEKFLELDKDNRIWWGEKGDGVPRLKRFLSEVKDGVVPQTLWKYEAVGHTQEAKEELLEFVDFNESENILNSLKPTRLLRHAIKIGTSPRGGDIVMDFFAGSGSTGHAVISQNMEDGGDRRFVLVQIAEPLPKPETSVRTIADLAKSRLRKVASESLKELNTKTALFEKDSVDTGFRVLVVDSSNMKDVYYRPDAVKWAELFEQVDNIKEDRSGEDLLFQVLLDWGVDLSSPILSERIGGKEVFFVEENALVGCFERNISEEVLKEIAARKPLRVVFRDGGFESDEAKINTEQVFKLLSPGTEVKVI
jgi:adenine-specific DNA-methyltransferase